MSTFYEDIVRFVANHLKCSICFNIFTKPVTLGCGHNFCQQCLQAHWARSKRDCPQCRTNVSSGALETNIALCYIVDRWREEWDVLSDADLEEKLEHSGRRDEKVENLLKRLEWLKAEIKNTEDSIAAELNSNKSCEDELSDSLTDGSSPADSEATSGFFSDDRRFSQTSQDAQQSSQSQKESSQEFLEGDLEASGSAFTTDHRISSEAANLQSSGAEAPQNLRFADLSFCPELANKRLFFSSETHRVETHPGRPARASHGCFDASQCMAQQEFREGVCYWDVITAFSTGWAVGIAYASLTRRERLGRTSSSWCLEWSSGELSAWHNNIKTVVKHGVSNGIRVILDMDKGDIWFQSLCEQQIELYHFQLNTSAPLRPVFWLYGLSKNALAFPKPY